MVGLGQEEIDSLVKSLEMVNKEIPEGFDQVSYSINRLRCRY